MTYWPWWAGALALSGVSIAYWLASRRLIGVSGLWNQALDHKRQRAIAKEPLPDAKPGLHWSTSLTFLVMLIIGGLLASLTRGTFEITGSMGAEFHGYFGTGVTAALVLIVGGAMVGFGTRLGGGCTSGHGLSGCSRLQPGSLVTTVAFFGTAIAVAIAMSAWRTM
jgi:uncharacterized membrane protein YedE/YeeE